MKSEYSVGVVSKREAAPLLTEYHYLGKRFKSGANYGLYHRGVLVGIAIFTGWSVPETVVGAFGLKRTEQAGLWELSRLVVQPDVQATEHNITGWFLSRAIKALRRDHVVRAILTYADDAHHKGTVYRATNFVYYGLTDPKKDFWFKQDDGTYVKHSRGSVKGKAGEWRERTRKHRFLLVFDPTLTVKWSRV